MRKFVLFYLFGMFLIVQFCLDASLIDNNIFQKTEIELGYYTGRFISIDEDYLEIGLFAPFYLSNCYTTFLDVHGYRFNDGKWASSAGLVIRQNLSEFSALGFNTYYDYRRGISRHNFHQIGLGFEWLKNCWDFRINGYLPVSQKTQTSNFCVFDQLGDGFFATSRRVEYAYNGFDAEIGMPLLSCCNFNLYGAAGPYYYMRSHQNHFWGGHGRLELDWKSIFYLQIRMSYDKVHSTNFQGVIQVSFPLDFCWKNCGCHGLMSKRVQRNGIILTDHCCDWTWNWDDKN